MGHSFYFSARQQGMLAMLVAVVLYAISDAMLKWMSSSYHPMQVLFCRSFFLMMPVLFFLIKDGIRKNLTTHKVKYHTIRAVVSAITVPCYIYAFRELPLADAYAVAYVSPLFMAIFAIPLLGEKVEKHSWVAIVVGFFGVLIMMRPGSSVLSFGGAAALGAGVFYALSLVMSRKLSQTESTMAISFWFTGVCLMLSGVFMPFVWKNPTSHDWFLFMILGFIGSLAQIFLTNAFKLAPAAVVAPLEYFILILGALIGYLVWNDVPSIFVVMGSLILVGSGLYLLYAEARSARVQVTNA